MAGGNRRGGQQPPQPAQPLHDAARNGNMEELKRLILENPASVNERDRHSRTPLHLAAWAGHTDAVKVLCQKDADVGAAAADDMAAIHFASQKGHTEAVRLILAAGAHVNSNTRKGMTPLHYAVQGGHAELTKLLIKRGANLQSRTKAGKTPIDLAKDEMFRSLVRTSESERQALRNAKKNPQVKVNAEAETVETEEKNQHDGAGASVRDINSETQVAGVEENVTGIAGVKRGGSEGTRKDEADGREDKEATALLGSRKKKTKVALSHLSVANEPEEEEF